MLLATLGWTASYAQVLIDPVSGDTLTCYNTETLRKIATRITYANECDSLYKLQELEIKALDSAAVLQSIILSNKDEIIVNMDAQIVMRDDHITNLNTVLKQKNTKIRWLKRAWAATGIAAGGAIIYLLVR